MSLAALRSQLALLVAPPPVAADLLPTGVAGLDAALGGGLPRGRLTEIAGPLGSGTATLARRLVTGLVARGLGVAYVDAARTLDPADWAHLAAGHLRVVRPPDAARGAWCADVLLRSGAFVLVVLDGAPALTRQQALRLVGLAREKDAAFVVVGQDRPSAVSGAVRLALRRRWGGLGRRMDAVEVSPPCSLRGPAGAAAIRVHGAESGARARSPALRTRIASSLAALAPRNEQGSASRASIQILVERGGNRELVELPGALDEPRRLGVHATGPDRRGTGRGRGKRWKGARNGGRKVPAGTPPRCTGIVRPSASPARASLWV
ncbi:MAG TPA: ATPase domain-containing protein, partial [Gemmatimonadales bacterium]|nr:ATPase domain-containing protein [Gemmatimonadales bacterium]